MSRLRLRSRVVRCVTLLSESAACAAVKLAAMASPCSNYALALVRGCCTRHRERCRLRRGTLTSKDSLHQLFAAVWRSLILLATRPSFDGRMLCVGDDHCSVTGLFPLVRYLDFVGWVTRTRHTRAAELRFCKRTTAGTSAVPKKRLKQQKALI